MKEDKSDTSQAFNAVTIGYNIIVQMWLVGSVKIPNDGVKSPIIIILL